MSKDESSGDAVGSQTASPDASPADAPSKDPNAEIYENRGPKKIIRVVTVVAYLFSVSFVGILLSAYYLFLWEPPNPKLIVRERLLMDPQMQFLVVPSYEETDVAEQASENKLNRTYKTLINRTAQNTDDGDDPDIEKRTRISARLLRLSLMEAQRARNLNSSRQVATSNDDSFVAVKEEVLNSTKLVVRAEDSISRDAKSTSEEKSQSDNTNSPPPELADSTLHVENTSSTPAATIPGAEIKRSRLDEESVTDFNRLAASIVHRERENRNNERKLDAAKANDDVTNGSDHDRAYKDINNSSKVLREFPEVNDILGDSKGPIKQNQRSNKTDERQLINSDRENPNNSSDVRATAMPEEHVEDRTNHRLSMYAVVNNFRRNYFDSNRAEKIARDEASIGSSPSRGAGFTDNPPGFHQPPDEPNVVKQRPYATADSEETQIERMTARSATIDNEQLEEIDLSTTQRQKGLREILTETPDIEETSIELTPVSTVQNYLNFTSIANDNDESDERASHK